MFRSSRVIPVSEMRPIFVYWRECPDCGYETPAHGRVQCPGCGVHMGVDAVAGAVVDDRGGRRE